MKYPILKKFWYIIPFWGIIIIGLAELLNIAGIPLLSYLSNMVLIYSKYINYDTRVTIIHICFFLIIIYMIIYIHIYNKRITQNNYYQYMDILLLFHAGSIVFPVAFDRYISFLLIIYVYIFIDYFLIVKHKVRKNMTYAALILISIGMLAYQYVDAMNAWLFYL